MKKTVTFTTLNFVFLIFILIITSISGGMIIHQEYFSPNIRYFKDYKDIYSIHRADIENAILEISHDDNSLTIKIKDVEE